MPMHIKKDIILELVSEGKTDEEILEQVQQLTKLDAKSLETVQGKINEVRAARAFQPAHPPLKRIRLYGIVLMIVAVVILGYFAESGLHYVGRYNPSGYAFVILVIGFVLIVWPDKGLDKY